MNAVDTLILKANFQDRRSESENEIRVTKFGGVDLDSGERPFFLRNHAFF